MFLLVTSFIYVLNAERIAWIVQYMVRMQVIYRVFGKEVAHPMH